MLFWCYLHLEQFGRKGDYYEAIAPQSNVGPKLLLFRGGCNSPQRASRAMTLASKGNNLADHAAKRAVPNNY